MKVMLVDNDSARSALLSQALQDQGYQVVSRVAPGPSLLAKIAQVMPDMIVIDTDCPDRDMLESVSLLNKHNPLPVVMFADEESEAVIQQAIRSGVSGYISSHVQPERVKSIMKVAVARFREYQALKDELQQTKSELETSRLMQKAKALLMKHKKATEDEAHKAIMKMSMDQNKPVSEVAQNIIQVLDMQL
ncbi:transcriptional regulator [Thiosulfativibrio zosterae]|uniref:Transcriptional regulator n=2 Tax=Thiosulfativibrio zosterae TaxID=2675053 RepID=A0A6F8PP12_9GAMM|nr:transcriptional regulator [Thiosulfativibrio zosterae]